jgi:predicted small metal-binding protein
VIQKAREHAKKDHGMELTPELADKVRAAIQDR